MLRQNYFSDLKHPKPKTLAISPFFFCLSLAVMLCQNSARAEILEIPGTGACEPLMIKLAAEFSAKHPDLKVVAPPSIGSGGGIKAVMNDKAVLARVARPLKQTEAEAGLRRIVFARDAVVFGVGEKVDVQGLASAQLADIFAGKIMTWQEVGGSNAPVRVVIRENGDACLKVLQKNMAEFRDIAFSKNAKLVFHDTEMVDLLDKYKTAVGWLTASTMASSETALRALEVDGIAPVSENVTSGKYKFAVEYGLVYKPDKVSDSARRFMDFIFSSSGKEVLEENGLIPFPRQ